LTGKIYSLFNTKWTFISFFLLFELGSLICGVATSSTMLIIGRAIAGMGSSGLINGGMQMYVRCSFLAAQMANRSSSIYQAVPENRRPTIMGILMAISQIGLVGGPVLGGVLTEYASWRWCFYINLPVGAVATACLAVINIPDRKHKPDLGAGEAKWKAKAKKMIHELDLKGFVIFSGFSIMLVLALQWGGVKYAWSSSRIIGLLAGVGALLLIFCAQEYRIGDRAMFPWSVVKQMVVWSSGITQFLFFGSQMLVRSCGSNHNSPCFLSCLRET
jgi:MFS family permease